MLTAEAERKGGGTLSTADLALELLRDGQAVRLVARGRSMRPFVRDGDVLAIEPLGRMPALRGDILFYATTGGAAAHRLLGFRMQAGRRVAVTRGDATGLWAERVEWSQVLGVVVAVHREGRCVYRRWPIERMAGLSWAHARGLHLRARIAASRLKRVLTSPR